MDLGPCPRDGTALTRGAGALLEHVCSTCQGRLLDETTATSVLCERLGVPRDILAELARDGARLIGCPACGMLMAETRVRGVQIDLCGGCGAAWLDAGELRRLADLDEVHATRVVGGAREASTPVGTPALETATPAADSGVRLGVFCVSCDRELDLTVTNWLITDRPWCPACASPYTGVAGLFDRVLEIFSDARFTGSRDGFRAADVLRIEPQNAAKYFAPFSRFVRA